MKPNKSTEYQLGQYIGYYILHIYLPTLNTDMIQSKTVINVSEKEFNLYNQILNEFINSNDEVKKEKTFNELKKLRGKLKEKYLPKVLDCYLHALVINDENEIKKGIIDVLWDSDLCHYSLKSEDITVIYDKYTTLIKLVLD